MSTVLKLVRIKFAILNRLIITKFSRKIRNHFIRKRLEKYEFTVFSNNCIGGVFLHDAKKRFNTPTVNLAMDGVTFIKLLSNPEYLSNPEFEKEEHNDAPYPLGFLKGVGGVSFVHYKTFETAVEKWRQRSQRVLWSHVYIIATGHDGLETSELMAAFDRLPYKNKIMFTFGKWSQYDWAKQVKFKTYGQPFPFTNIATFTGKRIYETANFNLSKWIRRCEEELLA
jgi:uncharacterized protein (DUF1919 family)